VGSSGFVRQALRPWSGTSTNPARSLGPDVVSLGTHHYWLYWAAPVVGTFLALAGRRFLPVLRNLEVDIARVAHLDRTPVAFSSSAIGDSSTSKVLQTVRETFGQRRRRVP
jgi:Major intrinsic protein